MSGRVSALEAQIARTYAVMRGEVGGNLEDELDALVDRARRIAALAQTLIDQIL